MRRRDFGYRFGTDSLSDHLLNGGAAEVEATLKVRKPEVEATLRGAAEVEATLRGAAEVEA
jgi:hypothetical protein